MRSERGGHCLGVTVLLAWLGRPELSADVIASVGPWHELVEAAPGLLLVETDDTLSRVYHELKWLLPDDCPLLVAPIAERPKARGVASGTVTWLRRRLRLPDR